LNTVVYLLIGAVLWASHGMMPLDALADMQADPSAPPRRREIAAAIVLYCIALAVWPFAIPLRAAFTVWRRFLRKPTSRPLIDPPTAPGSGAVVGPIRSYCVPTAQTGSPR
jgi:hypothetical protein